jgi:hypothetical protein
MLGLLIALATASTAVAAGGGTDRSAGPSATVTTTADPVRVDGVQDEADWARATPVTAFTRFLPSPGGDPPGDTEVRFLQDETHLYIGVRVSGCDYPIRGHISPREDVNVDDQVGIYLDPFGEGRTGNIFYINSLGVQQDIRYAYGEWNINWNAVFESEGQVTDDGFIIEVAIPFRSLRYPDVKGNRGQEVQSWGIMVTRKVPGEGTKYAWPVLAARHPRMFTQAAKLNGIRPGSAGAGIELIPVIAGRFAMDRGETGNDPLTWTGADPWWDTARPGLDARIGLTPDLGLAATLNPDYSQVEGDVEQVDLNRRVDPRNPERRPFFLDGFDAFDDEAHTLYTRSIVSPIAGTKLSGRIGRFSIGTLAALDRDPQGSVLESADTGTGTPGFSAEDVADAWANNVVARTRIDVLDNGYVGLTAGDKRLLTQDGLSLTPTGAHSDVALIDTQLPISETWTAAGFVSGSSAGVPGDELVDGSGGAGITRVPSIGTGGSVSAYTLGPDYRNELGFISRTGITGGKASVDQRYNAGDSAGITSLLAEGFDAQNGERFRTAGVGQEFELIGNHEVEVVARWQEQSDALTVQGWMLEAEYEALVSRSLGWTLGAEGGRELDFDGDAAADTIKGDVEFNLRPTVSTRLDLRWVEEWQAPDGEGIEHARTAWTRATWQLTKPLGVRAIAQHAEGEVFAPGWTTSFLMTWFKHPGTEAYLGASWRIQPEGEGEGLTEQVLFAKYSHLFRL